MANHPEFLLNLTHRQYGRFNPVFYMEYKCFSAGGLFSIGVFNPNGTGHDSG